MRKQVQRFCSLYTNSLFFVLSIALLFLVFEAIGDEPNTQGAIEGAYTTSSLPIVNIEVTQVVVIGLTGLMVVGMLFLIQIRYEKENPRRL